MQDFDFSCQSGAKRHIIFRPVEENHWISSSSLAGRVSAHSSAGDGPAPEPSLSMGTQGTGCGTRVIAISRVKPPRLRSLPQPTRGRSRSEPRALPPRARHPQPPQAGSSAPFSSPASMAGDVPRARKPTSWLLSWPCRDKTSPLPEGMEPPWYLSRGHCRFAALPLVAATGQSLEEGTGEVPEVSQLLTM